jgi:hypothetical protein
MRHNVPSDKSASALLFSNLVMMPVSAMNRIVGMWYCVTFIFSLPLKPRMFLNLEPSLLNVYLGLKSGTLHAPFSVVTSLYCMASCITKLILHFYQFYGGRSHAKIKLYKSRCEDTWASSTCVWQCMECTLKDQEVPRIQALEKGKTIPVTG